ncbi:MAG: leucyl aminopeptidase family protein [Pseudomonadota bacterium]
MTDLALSKSKTNAVPVHLVKKGALSKTNDLSDFAVSWAKANSFDGAAEKILKVPNDKGKLDCVLFGMGDGANPMITGSLPTSLPDGKYRFMESDLDSDLAALGWLLGAYSFNDYRSGKTGGAKLVLSSDVSQKDIRLKAEAVFLARDLINTPANDLGPAELENAIRKLGKEHKARVSVTKGDALLQKNFPMVHAVGRASADAPRLIDLRWGRADAPKVTLVGKGVTFDSGGLNIKPGNSMALMKKDMGGAANTIALAKMIMEAKLPVRLRLLVPAVENAISGNAFRPGDILASRKGISVEIGNTDAEGRLILADALALGDEEKPDLMIDMATLTGAARVALGPDLPPFYTDDDMLAEKIGSVSQEVYDPLWRMPLWPPYQKMLASRVADVNHISTGGFAGSVTAALFLSRFVENAGSWVHFDIYGWVPSAKPWAPVGGEAQGIRTLFEVLSKRYIK